jgi:tetratricopeptide (TPR) repeat protein
MRKEIASVLIALAVLASLDLGRAEEPKATPAKKTTAAERQEQRKKAFEAAVSSKDFDKALAILEEVLGDKEVSDKDRFEADCGRFIIWATEKKDGAKACPLAKKLSEQKKDDAALLNELAWTILDTPDLKNRDLDVAMAIAQRAAEVSKYDDPAILDTLARAHFEKGNLTKAIEFQTKAVEKSEKNPKIRDDIKAQIKETLEKYQDKKAEKIS